METNKLSGLNNNPVAYFKEAKKQQRKKALKIVGIVVPVAILLIFLFILFVGGIMKNTDAYKVAVENIKQNDEIKKATGGIKDFGYMIADHVETTNGNGEANLSINVIGEKKDVDVSVSLLKQNGGKWKITEMYIEQ